MPWKVVLVHSLDLTMRLGKRGRERRREEGSVDGEFPST
jgi:hypothetical protein